GREQVVGLTVGRPRHQVGGGGDDQDEVCPLAETDVRDLVDVVPYLRRHRMPGQRRPRGGADEVECGAGRDDPDVVAGLGKPAQHLTRFVRSDAPADAENDAGAFGRAQRRLGHRECYSDSPDWAGSGDSAVSRPWSISRSAIDSGFSCTWVSTSGPTYSSSPSPSWE